MIRRFLDLSTAHISRETNDWLEAEIEENNLLIGGRFQHVHPIFDTGYFIWADPEPKNFVPEDLRRIFKHARSLNCDYVLLDRDADILDELPTYDW